MSQSSVVMVPDAVQVPQDLLLSGTVVSLREDLAAALGLPIKVEGVPNSRGVRTISMADSAAKNDMIASLIVEDFITHHLNLSGASPELIAQVAEHYASFGRNKGSAALLATLFLNRSKSDPNHAYLGLKCNSFLTARV